MNADVKGYCPMGCGKTLFHSASGHITCSYIDCPRPTVVTALLAEQETEHVVQFDDDGFTVKHPLRERIDDALLDCQLHAYCHGLAGPPVQPGRYRVTHVDDRWHFTAMENA